MTTRRTNIRTPTYAERHPGTEAAALTAALADIYTEAEVRERLDDNNRQTWWYRKQQIRDACGFRVRQNWFYHKDLVEGFLISIRP